MVRKIFDPNFFRSDTPMSIPIRIIDSEHCGFDADEIIELTWKLRIMIQMRPSVSFGLPSTISSGRIFTSFI
jgi:hypothetical protein